MTFSPGLFPAALLLVPTGACAPGPKLAADPVGLVFAARAPGGELAGLPELAVEGLGEEDARTRSTSKG